MRKPLMGRVRVFCSYAEADKGYYDELSAHLAALRKSGCIEMWSHVEVAPGEDRKQRIAKELEDADVVLFLVSADFIASTSCFDEQMLRVLELADAGQVIAAPILVRNCDWESLPFARIGMFPEDEKPIANRTPPERDDAWASVAHWMRVMLGRKGRWGEPPMDLPPLMLDLLLTQFLHRWPEWGFNASRISKWGSRQPGFDALGQASAEEIQDALRRLAAAGRARAFKATSGAPLYKSVQMPQ